MNCCFVIFFSVMTCDFAVSSCWIKKIVIRWTSSYFEVFLQKWSLFLALISALFMICLCLEVIGQISWVFFCSCQVVEVHIKMLWLFSSFSWLLSFVNVYTTVVSSVFLYVFVAVCHFEHFLIYSIFFAMNLCHS